MRYNFKHGDRPSDSSQLKILVRQNNEIIELLKKILKQLDEREKIVFEPPAHPISPSTPYPNPFIMPNPNPWYVDPTQTPSIPVYPSGPWAGSWTVPCEMASSIATTTAQAHKNSKNTTKQTEEE